jgi:hypothetical protein
MTLRAVLPFAFVLALAACTGQSAVTTTESSPTTEDSDQPTEPGVGSGELVILDGNGDVVIIDPDGTDRRAITTDAGDDAVYFQPIWSPDSTHIAWGQIDTDGFGVGYRGVEEDDPTVVPMVGLPFYLYWAFNGESIGALHNGAAGLDLELVDVASGTSSILDSGTPFYFSWNPTGDGMVIHVGPDRFEMITADGDRHIGGSTSADYYVPQWTDNGIVHVDGAALVVQSPEGARREVVRVNGFTAFVVNPRGTRVAVQSIRTEEAIAFQNVEIETVPSNRLAVVDIETGEFEVVNEAPALAFFWSPNGESLLIFAPASPGDGLVALVWTLATGMREYGNFVPPEPVARDLLPFFPQYAQSMSFWSPDSAAFAYPSIVDGTSSIWVQPLDQTTPERVSQGSWVSWSR